MSSHFEEDVTTKPKTSWDNFKQIMMSKPPPQLEKLTRRRLHFRIFSITILFMVAAWRHPEHSYIASYIQGYMQEKHEKELLANAASFEKEKRRRNKEDAV